MTEFTPGPWHVVSRSDHFHKIKTDSRYLLASIIENEADARLMAAAPAMFEALRGTVAALEWYGGSRTTADDIDALNKARTAIDLATGDNDETK